MNNSNDKDEIKRNLIVDMLNTFKSKTFYRDSDIDYITDNFRKMFELELNELDVNFKADKDNLDNPFNVTIYEDEKSKNSLGEAYFGQERQDDGFYRSRKPLIAINCHYLYDKLQDKNPSNRMMAIKRYYKTIFHEVRHYKQWLCTQSNVSSKDSIMYARDFALKDTLGRRFYSRDEMTGNYDNYYIEKDANAIGYAKLFNILGDKDLNSPENKTLLSEQKEEYIKKHIAEYRINMKYKNVIFKSNGFINRDDLSSQVMDNILKYPENLDLLIKYPILKKEYHLDGTKKNALELALNHKKELKGINELDNNIASAEEKNFLTKQANDMYYELLYPQLSKISPDNFKQFIEVYGVNNTQALLNNIREYYNKEYETKVNSYLTHTREKMKNAKFFEKKQLKASYLDKENYYSMYYSNKIKNMYAREKDLESLIKFNKLNLNNTKTNNNSDSKKAVISQDDIVQSLKDNNISFNEIQDISKQTRQNIIEYNSNKNINKDKESENIR